jgi:rare lipoprotein A
MKKLITLLPLILILSACSTNQIKTSEASIQTPFISHLASTPKIKQQLITIKTPLKRQNSVLAFKEQSLINENDAELIENVEKTQEENWIPRITQYIKRGLASWYGPGFHGKKTATGEVFNMYEMTAAHKTLPIPSYAEVTNLKNNKSVIVRINDRGPYANNRVLDLSYAAAKKIGIHSQGTGKVEIKAISPLQALAQIQQTAEQQNKNVFLEIGSFESHNKALKLQDKIASNHLPESSIRTAKHRKNTLYKVQMGPINSTKNAEKLGYQLAKLGIKDPQIVTETRQN